MVTGGVILARGSGVHVSRGQHLVGHRNNLYKRSVLPPEVVLHRFDSVRNGQSCAFSCDWEAVD